MPPRSETRHPAKDSKPIPILPAETSKRPPAVRQSSPPLLLTPQSTSDSPAIPTTLPPPETPRRPQTSPQKPINFHFINLTDPEIDTETRKSINVHVQRVDRQKKRWERIKRPLENRERFPARLQPTPCRCSRSLTTSNLKQAVGGKHREQICLACGGQLLRLSGPKARSHDDTPQGTRASDLVVLLGQGRTNPFNTYPIEAQPDTDMLVDFFAQFIIPHHLAFGERENSPFLTQVVPTSLSDAAPFHGLLLTAAFYMFQATGEFKWAQMGFYHQGAGIRAINLSLGEPDRAVTNANITGVMYMIAFELANGDHTACRFHMNGLAQMVRLRGGIQDSHFGFLRNQIMWADRTAATLLGIEPFFSPIASPVSSPSEQNYLATPESLSPEPLNIGFRLLLEKGDLRPEVVKGLSMLCEWVAILSTTNDSNEWMKHLGPFSENNEFEYWLLQIPEEPITAMTDSQAIGECCRVAALHFFTAVMEERPSESGLIQSLGAQLKGRLELLDMERCLEVYSEELLWIVLGGSYRVRGQMRIWFAELLPRIYTRLGIETWEECLGILKRFLWLDKIAQPSLDLWMVSRQFIQQAS